MFFIGIFGIESKEKNLGCLSSLNCSDCNKCKLEVIKEFSFFHFFFIPLFKWNEHYYVICKNCTTIYEVKPEKGKLFEKGNLDVITYWDLKKINISRSPHIICPNCRKSISFDFEFCPYCGHKIKNS